MGNMEVLISRSWNEIPGQNWISTPIRRAKLLRAFYWGGGDAFKKIHIYEMQALPYSNTHKIWCNIVYSVNIIQVEL